MEQEVISLSEAEDSLNEAGAPDSDEDVVAIDDPGEFATTEEYLAVIKNAQLMIARLRKKLRKSEIELATLRSESKQRQSGSRNSVTEYDDDIKLLGRKFSVMEEPWIDRALFKRPRPQMAAISDERYASQLAIQQGVLADLYNFVPSKLHVVMQSHNRFAQKFVDAVIAQRSSTITKLRASVTKIFPHLDSAIFRDGYDRQSVPGVKALLAVPPGLEGLHDMAAVLFPQNNFNISLLFRSNVIIRILRMTLLGPTSVAADGSLSPIKSTGTPPVARKWGITVLTPGAVAFASIMALFLLSTDAPFSKSGQQSKINYESRFNAYKGVLLQGAANPAIKATLAYLNSRVLSTTVETNTTSAGPTDRGEGVASGISTLLKKMQLSDSNREDMRGGARAGAVGGHEYESDVEDEGSIRREDVIRGEGQYGEEGQESYSDGYNEGDGESEEDEVDNNDLILHALQASVLSTVVRPASARHPAAPPSAAFEAPALVTAHRHPTAPAASQRPARSAAPASSGALLPAAITPPAAIAPPAASHRRAGTQPPPAPLATSQPIDAHLATASQEPEIRGSKKPTKGKARAVPSAGGIRSTRSRATSGK